MRIVRRIPKESVVRTASLAAERCLRMSCFLQGRASATETVVSVCGLDSSLAESWGEATARELLLQGLAQRYVDGFGGSEWSHKL